MLKNKFQTLCKNFSSNQNLITTLWNEIEERHSEPTRYYHTLQHLEQFYKVLPIFTPVTEFAIFYHDIVYDASSNDNEKESTMLCEKRLSLLNVPSNLIEEVTQLILETKIHEASSQGNALFLDADLSILASSTEVYNQYIQNIRKEYALYSDEMYKEGRKKVLKHFLEKKRLYLSNFFYELYEVKARKNLDRELST